MALTTGQTEHFVIDTAIKRKRYAHQVTLRKYWKFLSCGVP